MSLGNTRVEDYHDYSNVIFFNKHRFQNDFGPHLNVKSAFSSSSALKSVFEEFHFRDGLIWVEGLTGGKTYVFKWVQIPPSTTLARQRDGIFRNLPAPGSCTFHKMRKRSMFRVGFSQFCWKGLRPYKCPKQKSAKNEELINLSLACPAHV